MKQLIALLTTGFYVLVSCAQPGPLNMSLTKIHHAKGLGLKGKVKSVVEMNYQTTSSGVEQGSTMYYRFDATGNLTEVKHEMMFMNKPMGTVVEKYSYDAGGKLVKISWFDGDGKGGDETETYIYDGKGKLTGKDRTSPNYKSKENYEYDAKGRLIGKKEFREGAKTPFLVSKYTYDEMVRRILDESENAETKKDSRIKYTYTGKNLQPETSNAEGKIDHSFSSATGTAYEYNSSGDISASSPFNAAGKSGMSATKYSYTYDNAGNWTKVTHTGLGSGYKTRSIEYFPAEETGPARYKRAVMEVGEPPMTAFGKLVEATMSKNTSTSSLLNDHKQMQELATISLGKLKGISDLPGNNTKKLAQQLIEFLVAPATVKQVQQIIKKEGDYMQYFKSIGMQIQTLQREMQAEYMKLP